MQPLQCVVLSHGLDRLSETISKRNRNAAQLDLGLREIDEVRVPRRLAGHVETFALYMVLAERRDELLKFLSTRGIEAKVHYPIPLHMQEAAQTNCKFDKHALPAVTRQADELLTLPIHQFLDEGQVSYMIDNIKEFYGKS